MTSFIGIYKAIYDYEAQTEEELNLSENDLLYLLETSDVDDWWKVKKRIVGSDVEEPVGLVPSNYIEVAPVLNTASLLFDYDKQTDEELSFKEGDVFDVYDTTDQDWILVGLNKSQFGFVPANYIGIGAVGAPQLAMAPIAAAPIALAPILAPQTNYGSTINPSNFMPPPKRIDQTPSPAELEAPPLLPSKENGNHFEDDDELPRMPSRKLLSRSQSYDDDDDYEMSPEDFNKDDFFTWPVQEIDSKGKKIKNTLGIGNGTVYLSPDASTGATPKQWKVQNLVNFSNEKKHVFLEFEKPYANVELHAGSKDAADAIVSVLGDIKGAVSMKGLKEVKAASVPSTSKGRQTGTIIFDFEAATEDELSVKENDTVFIINDKKSKDWWMVENIETGEQGVIPSNYVELNKSMKKNSSSNFISKMSQRVANPNKKKKKEREREKLKIEHAQRERDLEDQQKERRRARREREREREIRDRDEREKIRKYDERERLKREKRHSQQQLQQKDEKSNRPNPHRVRTWIDRSGSFKVEAEFLGCVDGKIHLHKSNGVKIAVAAPKLSTEDLEYVERVTGMSLENYKPQPPPQPMRPQQTGNVVLENKPERVTSGTPKGPQYDWFEFFLNCGVDVNNCQRYQLNFDKEQMDENILEDITPSLLRTLGLREGDILRVMKFLDLKFNRVNGVTPTATGPSNGGGGMFQGANGNLSTDRVASQDKVDSSKLTSPTKPNQFEDDAWAVKPAAQTGSQAGSQTNLAQQPPSRPSSVPTQQFNGSISDLINIKPMDSNKTGSTTASAAVKPAAPTLQPIKTGGGLLPQMTSGTMATQFTGGFLTAQPTGFVPIGNFIPTQMTGGFITAQPTGLLPLQLTGMMMPLQKTGGLVMQQPTGLMMPLQKTGGLQSMPTTSFGQMPSQKTGQMPLQQTGAMQSFGQMPLQKTGGLLPLQPTGFNGMPTTSFGQMPLQMPLQKTGQMPLQQTGAMQSFGQMPLQKTGGLLPLQPTGFNGMSMPTTSFGQQPSTLPAQKTGGFVPQTSFGQMLVQKTGGNLAMPATSFNSQPTGGLNMMPKANTTTPFGMPQQTGAFASNNPFPQQQQQQQPALSMQITFNQSPPQSQPGLNLPLQQTGMFNQIPPQQNNFFNQQPQQQQFGMNNLNNMFQNTSISSPMPQQQQQQQPFTSFGQQQQQPQFGGFSAMDQPLQSQPTGFGFGNSGLQPQKTGRANLANATADNPFGF